MSFDVLQDKIIETQNPTVAGLDARIEYVPEHIRKACYEQYGLNLRGACEAIWQFNVGLIDALCGVVPAVKPQSAYYENLGWQGMEMLERTIRYAKSKDYDTSLVKDIGGFTDSDQVASYAKRALQWAYANGIIGGTSETTLSPKGSATRSQVATILMRFDEKIIVPAQEKAAKEAAEAEK